MSFLKELTDKGATIAWSTVAAHPSLIALGTKDSGGGSGFEDHGGELELHKLDFSQETDAAGGGGGGAGAGTLLGKVKTTARFATLAWSEMATKQAEYPYGLIAGGMGDGTVNVWDPAKLVASHPQPQVASVARHSGPVTGLNFNPHKSSSHLLASGGADSEVFIMALDRPDAPTVFVPGPKPNTVSHIMATAAQNGSCIVWDLKQKKPWCELRDPNRAPITDVAWNPDQGQHLVTASGDDNNPVLKLWDLRSSTTLPLATLSGHSEGVLSVAWCPYDASLLMSCAKDNRTLLWDLFSLKPVYELPPGAGAELPAGGGSILDDESEGAGGDGIPAESELADAMAGVDLDETKFSKPGGSGGGLFSGAPPGAVGGGAGGGGVSNGQPLTKEAEAVIKRSLLVGNFEAAVQCCMSTGNMADAMLLASCGGADLWAKTQAQYFARESHQRPFLKVVNAIIKSELGVLVEASDLGQWQETLAILSTYAKQEEFPTLCEALASRLETEAGDRKSANLCYMCAVKVPKTVEMWAEELKSANAAINGGTDTKALQEFVEKVSVFTQEPNDPPGEEVSAIFAEYAGILASEGETETAFKYIKGQGQNGAVLQDRLYHSAPHAAGTPAPPFPFERARVGVSPQSVVGGGSGAGVAGGGANGAAAGSGGAGSARARSDPRGSTAAGGGGDALPPGWTQMGGFVGGGAPGGAGGYPGGAGFPGDAGGSNRMRPGGGAGVGPGGAPGGAVHSPMRGMREGSGAGGMMPSSSPSPPGAPPAAPTSTASAASSIAAAAPAPPPPSDAESQAVVSALNGMLGALSEAPLSPPEKKMLGDVTKAVGILFGKMGRGQVEQETLAKVGQLVESLQARDIKRAGAVQQGLANSAWASHKDWLKGLKYLTTLVSRRLV
ncbi:unnamed protein product [Ectocarpus sp. 6 AP-2014]